MRKGMVCRKSGCICPCGFRYEDVQYTCPCASCLIKMMCMNVCDLTMKYFMLNWGDYGQLLTTSSQQKEKYNEFRDLT
jgi:hypothetical protein